MAEQRPAYGAGVDEERLHQLREARRMSVRERLQLLDDLNRTAERFRGIARQPRRPDPGALELLSDRPGWEVTELEGTAPVPLASYLKALGVLRLLSEQGGAQGPEGPVRGWWDRERFWIWSPHDQDGLLDFFLHRYAPTPIMAPWNGGGGFHEGKPESQTGPVRALQASPAERFAGLSEAIRVARRVMRAIGVDAVPDKEGKISLVTALRSEIPDKALPWLDAVAILTTDELAFPPLLGSGGNDGNFEFANNFMQRLCELFQTETGAPSEDTPTLLRHSLFGSPTVGLGRAAIGQFSPGSAGGPNSTSGFSGNPIVNPWDYVLMLEGTILFAARVARRLESDRRGHLSAPFTVRPSGVGSGSAGGTDEGTARGEVWMPLWSTPASLSEIQALMGEGRVAVGRRTAGNGMDFVRGLAKLGADRGIEQFQRYAFFRRSGKNHLASPIGRVQVRRNPRADLIDELDRDQWLESVRRYGAAEDRPARLRSLVRRLNDALFRMAEGRQAPLLPAAEVVIHLGDLHLYMARSPGAREKVRPVPVLGRGWFEAANDSSPEFQIAAAFAGLHARGPEADGRRSVLFPVVENLFPLQQEHRSARGRRAWNPQGRNRAVWGPGGLDVNMARLLHRRLLDAAGANLDDLPMESWRSAPLGAVGRWLEDRLDPDRITRFLLGLGLITLPPGTAATRSLEAPVPAAFRVLKPLFTPDRQLRRIGILEADARVPPSPQVIRLLGANRVREATAEALRVLRIRGIGELREVPSARGTPGPRLLSVLMLPVRDGALARLLDPLAVSANNPAAGRTPPSNAETNR